MASDQQKYALPSDEVIAQHPEPIPRHQQKAGYQLEGDDMVTSQ
jgi:hypothetical protein